MKPDKAHEATDRRLERMEKRIARIYRTASKEVGEKAKSFFDEFTAEDEKRAKLVAEGKMSKTAYHLWRRQNIMQTERFIQLQEVLTQSLANANKTALSYINGELPAVYSLNYNAIGEGIRQAVNGYSFTLLDASTVKRLTAENPQLLPEKKLDIPKDKKWNRKLIKSQVLQGIVQGDTIPQISKRMEHVVGMNANSAVRNARTMVTNAENGGRMDMMHKAATDGVIMRKRWIATTDSRTRDWHRDLDGKEADMDEPFQNDFGDIMFPGDPTADGANVYSCRCTLGYRVVGFGNAQVQEAMAEKQVQEQPISRKPEEYTDSASVDKRLAELQKEMGTSTDFNRWVEIEKEQSELADRKKLLLKQESEARAKETQRRIYEKDYFATKGIGSGYAVDLDGIDEQSMLDVEKAMDSIFGKFPVLKNKFSGISVVDDLPEGAMASCGRSFGEVSLSRSYFGKNSKVSDAWKRCVESGFHPIGTSSYSAIVHEFGHSVDHLITRKGNIFDPKYIGKDATASTAIKKSVYKKLGISDGDVASGLSSYATMNDKEFVAEAFAEYVTSPTPRPIAVAVGEEIKKMLGGLF